MDYRIAYWFFVQMVLTSANILFSEHRHTKLLILVNKFTRCHPQNSQQTRNLTFYQPVPQASQRLRLSRSFQLPTSTVQIFSPGYYSLSEKTKSLLINFPAKIIKQTAVLTIKKAGEKEKVTNLVLEK